MIASTSRSAASSRSLLSLRFTRLLSGVNFHDITETQLLDQLSTWNEPSFRAKQVRSWVYERGAQSFNEMTNLPNALRGKRSEKYKLQTLTIAMEQISKDGTIKRAYELQDKQIIESVLMPYDDGRFTACISSQAGCAMGCTFCATGQMGFARQLSSTEIYEQVQRFSSELAAKRKRLSNVVFMGMGEPLANYRNVMAAIRRIQSELGIGARSITVSTVGIAPRIRKLATEDIQVDLAVSLHQADNAVRSALMPVNDRYPLPELLDACRFYIATTNRRISFEWALIAGQTDSIETAHELGGLLEGMLCHVNVIPLNPTPGFAGKPTSREQVKKFCEVLKKSYGIAATPRTKRGVDINAGCGQLRTDLLQRRKRETQIL